MKVALGADHCGYEGEAPHFKPEIRRCLEDLGHEVIDCGTFSDASVDYPDYAAKVAQAILSGKAEMGVLICGTGMGISIAANRHKGIRATVCVTPEMVRLAREHNNANVLCIGKRILNLDQSRELIKLWFEIPFSGGERHIRRIEKLDHLGTCELPAG
ncbi:MAG: ribose 5-phosphate isomerase B [Candidatus Hydrogenedentes bacterium]|nr:ribose 5-phosphate isomerase B [Candidatus Hydrogenedentota bacterium]